MHSMVLHYDFNENATVRTRDLLQPGVAVLQQINTRARVGRGEVSFLVVLKDGEASKHKHEHEPSDSPWHQPLPQAERHAV